MWKLLQIRLREKNWSHQKAVQIRNSPNYPAKHQNQVNALKSKSKRRKILNLTSLCIKRKTNDEEGQAVKLFMDHLRQSRRRRRTVLHSWYCSQTDCSQSMTMNLVMWILKRSIHIWPIHHFQLWVNFLPSDVGMVSIKNDCFAAKWLFVLALT